MCSFLSCLYGSQLTAPPFNLPNQFLSCLYGSQLSYYVHSIDNQFLSCLYGSQHVEAVRRAPDNFLSCLYGSQQTKSRTGAPQRFLSCLYGSQRQESSLPIAPNISKLPIRQSTEGESERASAPSRETHLHLFYPKFQQGARKADRIGFSCIGQKFWSKFRDRCTIAQAIGAQCSGLLYLTGCLLDEEGKGLRGR